MSVVKTDTGWVVDGVYRIGLGGEVWFDSKQINNETLFKVLKLAKELTK